MATTKASHSTSPLSPLITARIKGRPQASPWFTLMPRLGSVDGLAEEHPVESVLLALVGLGVPMARVVGEILGHGLVGVQPDLAKTQAARLFLSQCEQPGADSAALGCGQDGDIVQQQIARLGNDDGKADDLPVLEGSPRLPVADRLRIVGGHRRRCPADPGHVLLVSGSRDRAELIDVAGASTADHDHSRRIDSPPARSMQEASGWRGAALSWHRATLTWRGTSNRL